MKPLARSRRWVGALRAEFREERLGAKTFSQDRPFPDRMMARIVVATSAPLARRPSPKARPLIPLRPSAAPTTWVSLAKPTPILSAWGF